VKRIKKATKYLGIILVLVILFRGFLYRTLVHYTLVDTRSSVTLTNKKLIEEIDKETRGVVLDIDEIIDVCNSITSKRLSFTFDAVPGNPNEVYDFGKANCVGYSALFNSIGNYIVNQQNQNLQYEFTHHVGKLFFLGIDMHTMSDNPFLSNHDFNKVTVVATGETIYLDPSMRDYLRIRTVTSYK
jgi:hypothetical protein